LPQASILEERARRQTVEWLFGSGVRAIDEQIGDATFSLQSEFRQTVADLRAEVAGVARRDQDAVHAELADLRNQLAARPTREQVDEIAATARRATDEADRLRGLLVEQERQSREELQSERRSTAALREEVRELAAQLELQLGDVSRETQLRAAADKARLDAVATEVQRMHHAKASQQEMMKLVATLKQRPTAGTSTVEPLLTVPYPLPPSSVVRRPSTSRPASRPSSASPRGRTTHAAAYLSQPYTELREIATAEPPSAEPGRRPVVYNTEQIAVSVIPADAAQADPADPAVAMAGLSCQHSFISSRPLSASRARGRPSSARGAAASPRADGMDYVNRFAGKTDRLVRAMDG